MFSIAYGITNVLHVKPFKGLYYKTYYYWVLPRFIYFEYIYTYLFRYIYFSKVDVNPFVIRTQKIKVICMNSTVWYL